MGIVNEFISRSQGQTSYRVRVKSFIQKMYNWNSGRVIRLKSFTVDGVKLKIGVYPNGIDETCEGFVSLSIESMNNFELVLNFDLTFGSNTKEFKDTTLYFDPNNTNFLPFMHSHSENHKPFYRVDEDFEITFTVKKVWKQFDDEDNDSHSSVFEAISTVQDSVSDLKDKIESLEESMKTLRGNS